MASLEQIKAQRDKVSASIDAWGVAEEQASADATQAASASALAQTAQQTADASAALADQKRTEAQAEAQLLVDLFSEPPSLRKEKKP
jgi:hypothetical protein